MTFPHFSEEYGAIYPMHSWERAFDGFNSLSDKLSVNKWQGWQKIQNFEKIHGWMDKIGFIWIKYGDFFKNGFFQKYLTNV